MSANFCESLLMLRPNGERAVVTVTTAWSRAFLPAAREPGREVQLSQEVFEAAEALGPRLRSLPEPRVDRFYGFVDELAGNRLRTTRGHAARCASPCSSRMRNSTLAPICL